MKFSRSSIETHTRHLHRLTLAEYEAKHGVPEYDEGSTNSTQSANKTSHDALSTARQTMDPHQTSDNGDTTPATATTTALAVRDVSLPGSSAWLPLPSYQHAVGQTIQANVENGK